MLIYHQTKVFRVKGGAAWLSTNLSTPPHHNTRRDTPHHNIAVQADKGRKGQYNMKLTKKQIDAIRRKTPASLKGKQDRIYTELGYYRPSNANWSYIAGWNRDGQLIVIRCGEVM